MSERQGLFYPRTASSRRCRGPIRTSWSRWNTAPIRRNCSVDFRRLYAREDVHAGLVIIAPQVRPIVQRALFEAVLDMQADGRDPINEVFEVSIEDNGIVVDRYALRG